MDDFAGWPVWGWLSPGGIPCLNPVSRLRPLARRRNNPGGSARGRSRDAITRLDVGMRYSGERVRSISEHLWIDGGRMRGRARDRLARSRPDRAACNRGKGRCRCQYCLRSKFLLSYPCAQSGLSSVKPASDAAMTSITHSLKANDIRSCATTKNWSESRRRG